MKALFIILIALGMSVSIYAQTYKPVTSKNKIYLATVKGLTYSYKNGVITLKNNGSYDLGTVSIIATSTTDPELFGIALFEEGLDKGSTTKAEVYFTTGTGAKSIEIPLNKVDQKSLIFTFDKATRAQR